MSRKIRHESTLSIEACVLDAKLDKSAGENGVSTEAIPTTRIFESVPNCYFEESVPVSDNINCLTGKPCDYQSGRSL